MTPEDLKRIIDVEGNERRGVYKGLKWEITRNMRMGHLCGYVFFPVNDFDFNVVDAADYLDIELDVHGGVTYFSSCDEFHKVGFDCSHAGDLTIGLNMFQEMINELFGTLNGGRGKKETYKDMEFVEAEIEKMIENAIKEYSKPKGLPHLRMVRVGT